MRGKSRQTGEFSARSRVRERDGGRKAPAAKPVVSKPPPAPAAEPAVGVRHTGLAGTSFQVGKSKLTYGKAAKDVVLETAFTWDTITFVKGKYKVEGVVFTVVLHGDTIIAKSVSET